MLPLLPVGRATAYNPEGVGLGMNFAMIFLIAYIAVWPLVLIHAIKLTRRCATAGRRESRDEKKIILRPVLSDYSKFGVKKPCIVL
jgi:hypothetical protein